MCKCARTDTVYIHERTNVNIHGKDTLVVIFIDGLRGRDKKGNEINFIATIFNGVRQWEIGSDSTLIGGSGGRLKIKDFGKMIVDYKIYQDSYDIICIGLACEKGKLSRKKQEELSENRALALIDAISVDKEKGLYSLSYGQHLETENHSNNTDKQRSVVIFGVTDVGKERKEIQEALEDVLNQDYFKNSEYYYRDYSKYIDKTKSIEIVDRRDKKMK